MKTSLAIVITALLIAIGATAVKGAGGEMVKFTKDCAKELNYEMPSDGLPSNPQALAAMFLNAKKKCLGKCVLEKMNILDATGNLSMDKINKIKEKVPFAKTVDEKAITDCAEKAKSTAESCQMVIDIFKCIVSKKMPRV